MAGAVRRTAPVFAACSGLCGGLATCFGATTVTLGSELEEPAVCDTAVPPRAHSNAVDRRATAEGATKPDDNLMIISSRAKTDFAVPMCTIPRKLAQISELGH